MGTVASTWPPTTEILATSGAGIDDTSILLQSATATGEFVPSISCSGVYGYGLPAPVDPLCATLRLPSDFSVNSVQTDLNGDGSIDQAIAYSGSINPGCTAFDCHYVDTYVAVILQNAASPGVNLDLVRYLPRDGGFITWVVAADINGDGRPDLVIGQSNGLYVRQQDASLPGHFSGCSADLPLKASHVPVDLSGFALNQPRLRSKPESSGLSSWCSRP